MDPNIIFGRLVRLAKLDTSVFDEVRDDPKETLPAVAIVAISALLAGIGAWLWLTLVKPFGGLDIDFVNILLFIWLLGTILTVGAWALWVGVTWLVLQNVYKEQVEFQTLLRTMGYAAFPFAFSILMAIPALSMGFALVPLVGWFVLSIFAVQAASGAESDRVIKANLAGFLACCLLLGLFARGFGIATGVFVVSEGLKPAVEGEYYKSAAPDFDIP